MVASGHVHPSTLWSLVAGDLDPEQLAHLESHLDVCSGCARELARTRAIHRLLRHRATVEIPDPVRRRLEATIAQLGDPAEEEASASRAGLGDGVEQRDLEGAEVREGLSDAFDQRTDAS